MNEITLLKALADPTRLQIVRLVAQRKRTVSALVLQLGMEQSLVSHHLKVLREAGLVESRYQDAHVVYRLAHNSLRRLVHQVAATARAVEGTCNCVECGGPLLRPYPMDGPARPAGIRGSDAGD